MGKLRFFLEPKSIAIVGASTVEGKVGNAVVRNIVNSGYTGRVFPINPKPGQIYGYDTFPTVFDVLEEIDVAVICIPAKFVNDAAEQCGQKGVKGIIVVSAGFREVGGQGIVLEEKLVSICHKYNMRCVGPNSLGNITLSANMSFSHRTPKHGKIAMLSQSGAMMTAVLDWADTHNIGFSNFISLGNKADMDEVDFIEEIADDPTTSSLILYLESVNDGEKFLRVVSEATKKKPVVILKSGVSASGQAAASSHTGALAGDDVAFDLAFAKAGVIRVHTMNELFDLALFFDKVDPPLGDNFAIVTNAGGPGIIATDCCSSLGVNLTTFSEKTNAQLRSVLPFEASIRNPIDIVGDAPPQRYHDTLAAIFTEPPEVVAGAMVLVTPQSQTKPDEVAKVLVETKKEFSDRLIVATFMGGSTMNGPKSLLEGNRIPCYSFPEPMIRSVREIVKYRHLLQKVSQAPPEISHYPVDDARIDEILSQSNGLVDPQSASEIMTLYGINHPMSFIARNPDEAAAHAEKIGGKVVLKIISPQILHKSESGGIRTMVDLQDAANSFSSIIEDVSKNVPDADIHGVEVQQHINMVEYKKLTEVIIGMKRDPRWGPLIMVGMGGIYANYFKDASFALAKDYTKETAIEQLGKTKVNTILEGVRGQPRSDIEALVDIMVKIAQFVTDHPMVKELDLNPVFVFEKEPGKQGCLVVDCKIIT